MVSQGVAAGFEDGRRNCHLWQARDAGVDRFIETTLHGAQFQIRLSADSAHCLGEFGERRGVDQMYRKCQRHAQCYCQHRGGVAPGVMSQLLPGESLEQLWIH